MPFLARAMPYAAEAGPRARRIARAAGVVALLALAACALLTVLGFSVTIVRGSSFVGISAAVVLCLAGAPAWRLVGIGYIPWTIAYGHWAIAGPAGTLTWMDAFWVTMYPTVLVCLILQLRALRRPLVSVWLDGLIGALAVVALGTTLFVAPMLRGGMGDSLQAVVSLVYPIGDLALVTVALAAGGMAPGRASRSWALIAAGFTMFAIGDSAYVYRLTAEPRLVDSLMSMLWLVAIICIASAAWQPRPEQDAVHSGWRMFVASFVASMAAIALMLAAGLGAHVPPAAVLLAAASLLTAMARTAVTMRELRMFAETRRQATTDELTGLPNRRWFDRRLREAIAAARAAGGDLALMVIDLDHFKELNDTLGHHAGDRLLAQLGPRLREELRAGDDVARLGGDEFAVLLGGSADAERAAERIAAALNQRFTVEGIELQVAASIGIARFPEHGDDAETLLQRADVAMYQAKTRRSSTEVYARERDRHTRERLQLIGELRDAVAEDRLVLHYQPKLDLGRNRVNGVEALVRWEHPTRGMIPPAEFIPLAEQTGVIGPLTDLVIRKALLQAADWYARAIHLNMAVNVSATNLIEPGWTEGVLAALERHGVRPDRFIIEITEDVLMVDAERSLAALDALSAAGVRIALDDFGTGYSSLSYLKHMRIDELKIDRSFVFGMGSDPADAAIVETAVDLGRRLGIAVTAEGVENAAALRRLTEFGAGGAQGYHIARPMAALELDAWMAAGGFVLGHDEHVEGAGAVDALHPVQLDVGRRGRP